MANAYGSVTITTAPTQIVTTKSFRRGLLLVNNSSQTVYLGMDANVTTSNGLPVASNASFTNAGYLDLWRGPIFGIVAGTTADCRYWDWEEV